MKLFGKNQKYDPAIKNDGALRSASVPILLVRCDQARQINCVRDVAPCLR